MLLKILYGNQRRFLDSPRTNEALIPRTNAFQASSAQVRGKEVLRPSSAQVRGKEVSRLVLRTQVSE